MPYDNNYCRLTLKNVISIRKLMKDEDTFTPYPHKGIDDEEGYYNPETKHLNLWLHHSPADFW